MRSSGPRQPNISSGPYRSSSSKSGYRIAPRVRTRAGVVMQSSFAARVPRIGTAARVRNDKDPANPAGLGAVGILASVAAPRITLYGPRVMPLTEKVGRALRVKGLAFELVEPADADDYRRLSPETGLLPLLELGSERIPDSAAILDFLDERFPEPPLLSADARVAREQRRLERWIDETFPFYILRWMRSRAGEAVPIAAPGHGFPLVSLSQRGLIARDGRLLPEVFHTGEGPGPEFVRRLDDLEQMLGSRRFFYADRISRA